jgi:hypothetical protein
LAPQYQGEDGSAELPPPSSSCSFSLLCFTISLLKYQQVFIDTSGPEFIGWDDINGIDEVSE